MEPRGDRTVAGIPRWACPWAAGWSGMHKISVPNYERELLSLARRDRSAAEKELPKSYRRRIQRIGFAATGFAATAWLLAMVWVWQVIS